MAGIKRKEENKIQKTKIEWVKNPDGSQGYTINPVKGLCPVDCRDSQGSPYCYARRMYRRFKWNEHIRLDSTVFAPLDGKKPSKIFVGSTMELFGNWVKPEWMKFIMERVGVFKEHTFIFLTKRPENLPKEFPPNCWVGVSAPNLRDALIANKYMAKIQAVVKFLSIEPMFDWTPVDTIAGILLYYDWIIIGAQTPYSVKTTPRIEWVEEIVNICDKAEIPVFLKNNLKSLLPVDRPFYKPIPLWDDNWELRQEFPNG